METLILLNNDRSIVTSSPVDFLLEMLLKKRDELGEFPTINQLMNDKQMPTQSSYAYYFKTYDDAIASARIYERNKLGIPVTATVKAKYQPHFAKK